MSYKEEAASSKAKKLSGYGASKSSSSSPSPFTGMVKPATKHRASGGSVSMDGGSSSPRADKPHRGGKKHGSKKGGASHVNVLVNPKIGGGADTPPDPSMAGGMAGGPAMPPPGGAPMGGAPMPPPPGGAPMQPPMRTGGRIGRATGGKVIDDGAGSGEGREEKIEAYGKKAR